MEACPSALPFLQLNTKPAAWQRRVRVVAKAGIAPEAQIVTVNVICVLAGNGLSADAEQG